MKNEEILQASRTARFTMMAFGLGWLVGEVIFGKFIRAIALAFILQILGDVWWDMIEKPIEDDMYEREDENDK